MMHVFDLRGHALNQGHGCMKLLEGVQLDHVWLGFTIVMIEE